MRNTILPLALMVFGAAILLSYQNCGEGFQPRNEGPSSLCDPGTPYCPETCSDDPACEFEPLNTPFCSAAPREAYTCIENAQGCRELLIENCEGSDVCVGGVCETIFSTTTSSTSTTTILITTTSTTTTTTSTTTTTIPVTTTTTTTSSTTTTTVSNCGTPDFAHANLVYIPADDLIMFDLLNIGETLCPPGQKAVFAVHYRASGTSIWTLAFSRETYLSVLQDAGGVNDTRIFSATTQFGLPTGIELDLRFYVDFEDGNPNGQIPELSESNNDLVVPNYCSDCGGPSTTTTTLPVR